MNIVEQYHEILHLDGLDRIEVAGRTCYKSEDKIGCIHASVSACPHPTLSCDKCPDSSANKFTKTLIKRQHDAMLEHGSATVKFVTNRGVTHELVRHRMASFGQESTRYVKYNNVEFIKPVWLDEETVSAQVFIGACIDAEKAYQRLLLVGWAPEQAREVLPNSLKTEIVVTANYREWRHILKLRAIGTTGRPHPQMQAIMLPLLREFKEQVPGIFDDLVEKDGGVE